MTTTACANCKTVATDDQPLKLCGACKNVSYCNRDCQKASWKAHKSVCRQNKAGAKAKLDQATLDAMKDNNTLAEESLLPDGRLRFGESVMIPNDTCMVRMPPTAELPRGYLKMIFPPPGWLASISHLSREEQERAKYDFALQMDAMIEAQMTTESREAQRLENIEVGKVQKRFLAKLGAKEAAKEAAKGA